MSNLLTREAVGKLTKPEILDLIRKRGLHGHSGLNKPELIDFYVHPPPQSSIKSPGRPPGSGATKSPGKEKGKGKGRAVSQQSKSKTVDYSEEGLSNLTGKQLLVLVEKKGVSGYSGKSKGQIVKLLLAKPHRDLLELTFEKDGVVDKIFINPTNLSRVIPDVVSSSSGHTSVSTGQAIVPASQIMLPQEAFQASLVRTSPRGVVQTQVRVSPRNVMLPVTMPIVQTQVRVSPVMTMPVVQSQVRVSPRQLTPVMMPAVQSQVRVSPRQLTPVMMPVVQTQTRVSPNMPLYQQ